jgi:hypothetical protein
MHLTDADLGAALDPANAGARGTTADAHAGTCADCQSAIRQARGADREVADLLHVLDHATPTLDFASIQRRAGAHDRSRRPKLRTSSSATATKAAVRRAAIILGLSAAAAAALPPVRQFVAHVVRARQAAQPVPAPVVQSTVPSVASVPVAPRGVAIVPDEGRVDLIFRTAQPGGVLRIRPAAGMHVAVTANADGSTYTVGHGTIVVDARTTGVTYDIELPTPADLPDVSIRIGGRVVFVRRGAIVRTSGAVEADGSYRVPMSAEESSSH